MFELEDRGRVLRAADRDQITDYLVTLLTRGGYQVVPRAQLRERLADAKVGSYRACHDQAYVPHAEKLLVAVKGQLGPADLARAQQEAAALIEHYLTPQDRADKAHRRAHPEAYR